MQSWHGDVDAGNVVGDVAGNVVGGIDEDDDDVDLVMSKLTIHSLKRKLS